MIPKTDDPAVDQRTRVKKETKGIGKIRLAIVVPNFFQLVSESFHLTRCCLKFLFPLPVKIVEEVIATAVARGFRAVQICPDASPPMVRQAHHDKNSTACPELAEGKGEGNAIDGCFVKPSVFSGKEVFHPNALPCGTRPRSTAC